MDNKEAKTLISMTVKNIEGILSKISNDCFENDINIEKLTISEFKSKNKYNQKAIILLSCDSKKAEELLKDLKKKKLISNYYIYNHYSCIERELMLIKINSNNPKIEKITELFNEYKVENIYYSQGDNMVFQFASNEIRNNELMARLEKISDEIEILKSGMVAITITNDMKN